MSDTTVTPDGPTATDRYIIAGWFADHAGETIHAAYSGPFFWWPEDVKAELSPGHDLEDDRIVLRRALDGGYWGHFLTPSIVDTSIVDDALILVFDNGDDLHLFVDDEDDDGEDDESPHEAWTEAEWARLRGEVGEPKQS